MFYTYYELIDGDDIFVIEATSKEIETEKIHLRMYALNVYHVLDNGEVIYPVVYASDIKTSTPIFIFSLDIQDIIKNNIASRKYYDNLPIQNPYCKRINYEGKDYFETSIMKNILKYDALTCVYGIYDIEKRNQELWAIRRNGQEIFTFNPNEFKKYYDPDYDGADVDCYIGDGIIVDHMPDYIYGTDRLSINYLSYRLNFIGKLWCIEHGAKPAKDDLIEEE